MFNETFGFFVAFHCNWFFFTLMACPKQPFPRTSPYMRSEGQKMRCVLSTGSTRKDSERLMFLL